VIVDGAGLKYADREREEPLFSQQAQVHLAYDDAGIGEPTVVLLHGWGFGNPSHLVPQFKHLAARRRVLKLQLPGHGESDRPPPGFGFRDCAAAIVAGLDEAGIDRAILCGHSFGGRLAVEITAASPDRICGIALLDPVILFPEPVRLESVNGLVPALATDHWLQALEGYFSRLFSPYDAMELRSQVLGELGQVKVEMAASLMQEGMATDGSDPLAQVQCPVLLVTATAPVDTERFQELQPHALIGRVTGSGHWLTLAVPDQVNAMLDRFLEIALEGGRVVSNHMAMEAQTQQGHLTHGVTAPDRVL
jgi:pimeloyl-ACP methyl ester carboxylesterase